MSSCLVSSSLDLSCLVFLSLSSFSVSLTLSVSVSLCLRVMLCVVLCGVCRCGRGVVGGRGVCVWRLCVLRHGEKTWKNPCGDSKKPPCVHSNRPRVCRYTRAHVLKHVRVVPVHTETF